MFESLVVTLREGVEAALIVAIVLGYLKKVGRSDLAKSAYIGLGVATIFAIAAAMLFRRFQIDQDRFEGWGMLIASIFVATMVIWMWRTASRLKGEIENRIGQAAAASSGGFSLGVFLFVFLMVAREGVETVLFLGAVQFNTTAVMNFVGGLIGLSLAIAFGILFVKGSIRVNLRKFFSVTSIILLVVAVQLFISGLHELSESLILPASEREMAIIGPIVKNQAFFYVIILAHADKAAYRKAEATADPGKKIKALQKFLADFPASKYTSDARRNIFQTLVEKYPTQKDRIIACGKEYVSSEGTSTARKAFALNKVAGKLVEAGLYIDEAQQFINESITILQNLDAKEKEEYINYLRDQFKQYTSEPPSDESLEAFYTLDRADCLATLGKVYLKKGEIDKALKTLTEAYEAARAPWVASSLAEAYAQKGDDKQAFLYLAYSTLGTHSTQESRKRLEEHYRKLHGGSLDGLEETLDKMYLESNPIKAEPYTPSGTASGRVVLAELFTGAECPPCLGADMAFDGLMERYPSQYLAVLIYHQHIPGPDPMTNPSTVARSKFYGIQGTPGYAVDGKMSGGGGPTSYAKSLYHSLDSRVADDLHTPPEAELRIEADLEGNRVAVKARVDSLKSQSADLRLHIALVEDLLHYAGGNGVRFHPMVVRALAAPESHGFTIEQSSPASIEHVFDIGKISSDLNDYLDDYESHPEHRVEYLRKQQVKFRQRLTPINRDHLAVVAFVQDEKSKHVLQAAYVKIKPGEAAASK